MLEKLRFELFEWDWPIFVDVHFAKKVVTFTMLNIWDNTIQKLLELSFI